ncbi:hypothetical protein TNIN_328661 [Trichonephila inaurata madagascariensis]|uniref:Uncharacterized protein n=1 Tax=Trichonephila inaurata madagascariensis TaxID=2747483 RepID=A0A8X7CI16_9ARAC|nr:hypothetical protein TNIN_328661 [Trichonephila inaurata madagascariensis]
MHEKGRSPSRYVNGEVESGESSPLSDPCRSAILYAPSTRPHVPSSRALLVCLVHYRDDPTRSNPTWTDAAWPLGYTHRPTCVPRPRYAKLVDSNWELVDESFLNDQRVTVSQ